MDVCARPEILEVMVIVNRMLLIIKILVPIILIITSMYSYFKVTLSSDSDLKGAFNMFLTKIIIAAMIFFVPTIINSLIKLAAPKSDYTKCFANTSKTQITKAYQAYAKNAVAKAESSKDRTDVQDAYYYVNKLDSSSTKDNYEKRLQVVEKAIKDDLQKKKPEINTEPNNPSGSSSSDGSAGSGDPLNVSSYSSSGANGCQKGVYQYSEPNPANALSCWPSYINMSNFIFPKDEKTGLPLGAWPKNYQEIPTQLTNFKIYNGTFIFPITPANGTYTHVYDHTSIDIMSTFGTPVYSPVDGTLLYSEWGHTVNRGGDETAYSVTIQMSNPTVVGGKTISVMFLTHLSGIVRRCSRGTCNKQIQKGELVGFSGNAAGTATTPNWAPHLHMTFYTNGQSASIRTTPVEQLYGLTSGKQIRAGG